MHDDEIECVLKAAGRRERVPEDIEQAVREGVLKEWRAVVAERRGQRRSRAALAAAASVLVAVVGAWFAVSRPGSVEAPVATLSVAQQDVRVRSDWWRGWQPADAGRRLAAGEALETGLNGRAGLSLPHVASVRIDHGTRVRLASAERLVIERGAVYVDAGRDGAPASRLVVETPTGVVRHVGTQYEVRLDGGSVRVRVREGRVEWRSRRGVVENGQAGEQLTIAANGAVTRDDAARYGPSWEWIASTAPAPEIEGRPLAEFLAWAGRELGREVVFESPEVADEAASIIVHGSIDGLTPAQALDVVLATTSVRGTLDEGRLLVSRGG
jgi:ferric-dicitrate binding protein FerR (iron transport regulator)